MLPMLQFSVLSVLVSFPLIQYSILVADRKNFLVLIHLLQYQQEILSIFYTVFGVCNMVYSFLYLLHFYY